MIIYGTSRKKLSSETVMEKCPNCGNQFCVDVIIYQKWFHVFWIPIVPNGKVGVSQCSKCNQVLTPNQMSPNLKMTYDHLLKQAKAPIWTYSGIALIVGLIVFFTINDFMNDAKNKKFVLAPQKGDIFEVKTKDNFYTLYKVENVQGDSVFVRFNDYEATRAAGLADLKRKGDEAYSPVIFSFSKQEIKEMYDKGELLNIDRK
jgi:hypothetical protein